MRCHMAEQHSSPKLKVIYKYHFSVYMFHCRFEDVSVFPYYGQQPYCTRVVLGHKPTLTSGHNNDAI